MNYKEKLHDIGVDYLYHITDSDNLSSIIRSGGISSWQGTIVSDKIVARPGGDNISHRLDSRPGINRDNYVHVYLNSPSPKIVNSYKETGRFSELFILQISVDTIKENNCIFWLGDPYDPKTERIDDIDIFIDRIKSDPELLKDSILDIKDFISWRRINNLPESHTSKISEINPTAIVFVIDQSRSMKKSAILENIEYDYISDLAAEIVNEQIDFLLKLCTSEDGEIYHKFDIAVVGYGDDAYCAWNDHNMDGFQSPFQLYHHQKQGNDQYKWVDPVDSSIGSHSEKGLKYAYDLLSDWMDKRKYQSFFPPTVIHITDGDIPRSSQRDFLIMAEKIKSLKSFGDHVTLWNIGLTSNRMSERLLPSGEDISSFFNIPGAMVMYEASSYLREELKEKALHIFSASSDLSRRTLGINVNRDKLTKIMQMCIIPESNF